MKTERELTELLEAANTIKAAILQSQYRAARGVNREQLSLYFGIGRYISEHSRKGYWGTGAIENISGQLQKELPGLRGFSAPNLKFMRLFYEVWSQQLLEDAGSGGKSLATAIDLPEAGKIDTRQLLIPNRRLAAVEFDFEAFLGIGFTHHMEIIHKAKDVAERLFYVHQAFVNKWDKYTLREALKADIYHHQGALPNNFGGTMPTRESALKAVGMFKDEYLLDFINVEELGERDRADVDERIVENAIVHNVKNFIMAFGRDFTFVGNQYHLEKLGHDLYPDLLFYNRELAALVAVELKQGEFKPAYLGQLSAYLRVLDAEVKKPFENPSIGIILCKSADRSYVEFLLQGYDNPVGVATYRTKAQIRAVLPSEDELRRAMEE